MDCFFIIWKSCHLQDNQVQKKEVMRHDNVHGGLNVIYSTSSFSYFKSMTM